MPEIQLRTSLILLILLPLAVFGQDYQPTAIEGANWVVVDTETPHYPNSTFVRYIEGDTIIGGIAYKKLYQRVVDYVEEQFGPPLEPPYSLLPGKELIAMLRDEVAERRVYGRMTNFYLGTTELSADTLVHDYSSAVGDTLKGWYFAGEFDGPLVVEATGTEFYEGEMRQYQQANDLRFYEGIGSLEYGPTSGGSAFVLNCCRRYLVDYCAGDFPSCNIISSTVLLSNQLSITTSPNPFSEGISIGFSGASPVEITATLRDINGRVLRQEQLRGERRLETSNLASGVYFLSYRDGQSVQTVKLVKE